MRKQLFLTVRVPAGTAAGVYRGAVNVSALDGRRLYAVPVEVKVLDFALPRPKTRFDPEKDLIVSGFHYISLDIVRELISRPTYPAPKVTLNPKVTDFYDFTTADLVVEDYNHGPQVTDIPIAV